MLLLCADNSKIIDDGYFRTHTPWPPGWLATLQPALPTCRAGARRQPYWTREQGPVTLGSGTARVSLPRHCLHRSECQTRREVDVSDPAAIPYAPSFYQGVAARAAESAPAVLECVLQYIRPKTVVDVGCGTGEWLHAISSLTEVEVLGIDSLDVPTEALVISPRSFQHADLGRPIALDKKFDLAISLEVAEHLPAHRAHSFIRDLTRMAPAVLFGAAIPGQGGVSHINEQWQSYWAQLFADRGFEVWDVIRSALWTNDNVAFWYRQNTFLYVDPAVHGGAPPNSAAIVDMVHPELWRKRLTQLETNVQQSSSKRSLSLRVIGSTKRRVRNRFRHRT
jgi:SAM-dependent methyltransferase